MISHKKLVASFLILAAIASSSILFFASPKISNVNLNREDLEKQTAQNQLPNLGKSAFVEPIPHSEDLSQRLAAADLSENSSNNLTSNLADNLARELVALNPEGPQDQDGQTSIVAPDTDKLLGTININNGDLKKLIAERWKISIPQDKVKVINNYSADDVLAYSESLGKIFQDNWGGLQAQLPTELDQGISPRTLGSLKTAVQKVNLGLEKISVPSIALDFHKSFLTLLAHQRNGLALLDETEDPLKIAMLIQSQEQNYFKAVQNLEQEFKKLSSLKQFSLEKQNKLIAGFIGLFTIKQAHAFLGFGDIVFDPVLWARMVWEYLKKIAVELLKNQLIHQLVQQTIKWIQGGGKPQFIQNWKAFITEQAKDAAASAIYKILPGVCEPFQPLLKLALQPSIEIPTQQLSCTLDRIISNVEAFHDSFQNGSWLAYTTAIQPNNNFFGSMIQVSDVALRQSEKSKASADSESQGSQGFLSTKVCASPQRHTMTEIIDTNTLPPPYLETDAIAAADVIGEDYLKKSLNPTTGTFRTCTKDGWQNTTPGVALGRVVDSALGAPIHRIVNAQDIVGLVAALVNSFLNKLLLSGQTGLADPTATYGTTGSNVITDPKGAFTQEAYQILNNNQASIDMLNQLLPIASSTLEILRKAALGCVSVAGPQGDLYREKVARLLSYWTNLYNQWLVQLTNLQSQVDSLEIFIDNALNSPPDPLPPDYYLTKINDLHTTYGTVQTSTALLETYLNQLSNPSIIDGPAQAQALLDVCPYDPKTAFTSEANKILSNNQASIGVLDQLLIAASSTIQVLRQAISVCQSKIDPRADQYEQQAALLLAYWTPLYDQWLVQQANLRSQDSSLLAFINNALNDPAADYDALITTLYATYGTGQASADLLNQYQTQLSDPRIINDFDNAQDLLNTCEAFNI
ncbi:MAG: hypothetical protein HYT13_00165 [Candidatus Liptonbacteria bacterium]|nr:hypothetical protein [Candidatus Liptonbacteria bacterium]